MTTFLAQLALVAAWVADETPKPEDVKAGWGAFALFLLLIAAVAFLGFSLTKQLRKAQAAEDAGLYGNDNPPSTDPAEPEKHEAS